MKAPIVAAALTLALTAPGAALADDVTPIADVQRGTMVTVSGTVERILDEDEFRLTDQSGSITIYVGPNWVPADVGEAVTVHGLVDDGWTREIYARELMRADDSVVEFDHRYY